MDNSVSIFLVFHHILLLTFKLSKYSICMIKRRKALASIVTGIGGMISMPTWAQGWNVKSLGKIHIFNVEDDLLLQAIVDTILPATDTPGAKDVGVHVLIQKLVQDCQPKSVQDSLSMGLMTTNAVAIGKYGKSFIDLNPEEKKYVLTSMSASEYHEQKIFFNSIKRMTIDGYMKSEYALTNIIKWEMAPNRYLGCVQVKV